VLDSTLSSSDPYSLLLYLAKMLAALLDLLLRFENQWCFESGSMSSSEDGFENRFQFVCCVNEIVLDDLRLLCESLTNSV
jgi:hypothetical protein